MAATKIYLAGKVDPLSSFAGGDWREQYTDVIQKITGKRVVNLNPSRGTLRFPLDEGDPTLIFGRDCFMIRECDLMVVNLTNDISVGGSQEMLLAKYFEKPLLGIASKDGKFRKTQKTINGDTYEDWIHPFVQLPTDAIFEDIQGVARYLKLHSVDEIPRKNLGMIDESIRYYIDQVLQQSIVIQ